MALDRYCAAVRDVADGLLAAMASNLGLRRDVITGRCGGAGGGMQMVRMQCYPPCAQADKVVGISPHSDADLVTILLQVNGVDGLHIMRNNGAWLPVSPLEGAFVVNVGDVLQTNDQTLQSKSQTSYIMKRRVSKSFGSAPVFILVSAGMRAMQGKNRRVFHKGESTIEE
uniref:Fe2OG dioxygenase domain-containing protein n=1 Tax=Oryza brachyantha TaxID=4533 RepID=J3KZP3_ORYBR